MDYTFTLNLSSEVTVTLIIATLGIVLGVVYAYVKLKLANCI